MSDQVESKRLAENIRAGLDLDHIMRMALAAKDEIAAYGAASIELTPGDFTRYEILVIRRFRLMAEDNLGIRGRALKGYNVVLVNCSGQSYQWEGIKLHPDYVAAKWTQDGLLWTGVVLCEFLNALSDALPEEA